MGLDMAILLAIVRPLQVLIRTPVRILLLRCWKRMTLHIGLLFELVREDARMAHLKSTRDLGLIQQNLDNRTYDENHVYVPGRQGKQLLEWAQKAGLRGHTYTTVASLFFLASSLSWYFFCDSSCFNKALTLRWCVLLPFPRLGPSSIMGSVIFFFRFAASSERSFSCFLSRLRRVVIDAFSRDP